MHVQDFNEPPSFQDADGRRSIGIDSRLVLESQVSGARMHAEKLGRTANHPIGLSFGRGQRNRLLLLRPALDEVSSCHDGSTACGSPGRWAACPVGVGVTVMGFYAN